MEYRVRSGASIANPRGPEAPVANGEPETSAKLPVAESMAKAEIVLSNEFPTYKNFPLELTTTDSGMFPAGKGEPATWVNAPVFESIANTLTLAPFPFVTKR